MSRGKGRLHPARAPAACGPIATDIDQPVMATCRPAWSCSIISSVKESKLHSTASLCRAECTGYHGHRHTAMWQGKVSSERQTRWYSRQSLEALCRCGSPAPGSRLQLGHLSFGTGQAEPRGEESVWPATPSFRPIPRLPTPTMIGGQGLAPALRTDSTTKRMTPSRPSAG